MAVALATLVASTEYLWRRCRHLSELLARESERADAAARLAALTHETNYRLSCRLFGQTQVDDAIRRAHLRGVS